MNPIIHFIYVTIIISSVYLVSGTEVNSAQILFGKQVDPKEIVQYVNGNKCIAGIAGGKNTTITNHNYLAALYYRDEFRGSAIILNKKWLLTAAWNVFWSEANTFSVRVGSSLAYEQGQVYNVSSYVIHPNYHQDWPYDIALLKLNESLSFSKAVKGISLASKLPKNKAKAIVSGWGSDNNYTIAGKQLLKEATVPIISYKSCKPHYKDVSGFTVKSFCTIKYGVGPCYKDFGSPLVYKKKLIGLYLGAYECAGTATPPVYGDITKYKKWIEKIIKKDSNIGETKSEIEEEEVLDEIKGDEFSSDE